MSKYEIRHSCGHDQDHQIRGTNTARIAAEVGVTPGTVRAWVRGRTPTARNAAALAQAVAR